MQIRPEQLRNDLIAKQYPVYLLCGEEPLQHRECVDMLRKAAKYYGYDEREVYIADVHFDWSRLEVAASELSLFASKRLIELHIPSGKPSDKGAALIHYCENLPEDVILLIVAGKIESATRKSKWYKAIDKVAGIISVWPIAGTQLNQWLNKRLQLKKLSLQADSLQLINDRVEGNLLAADQEIEKLSLLYPSKDQMLALDYEQVSYAVFDNARYNVFDLFDCALSGDLKRASRMLYGLQREGQPIMLILTLLAREVRMLARMTEVMSQKQNIQEAMKGFYIYPKRKNLVTQALRNGKVEHWQQLLIRLLFADKMAKGIEAGDPWDLVQLVLAGIANKSYLDPGLIK
ncbi:MAG: DNA polymerase III subunit delta [gamma proteobacterium symbiont of Taylorina sp.]|nr:DNA polymerase III subunit delta [gamma proteobacterium symbiont of Taylorina sp.]